MHIDELHYDLPPERIAQYPAERRDESRLLVIDRSGGPLRHEAFARLPELLPPGALLVLNDTRVLPARLRLRRRSGGRIEGLFLHEPEPGVWELMLTESRRLRPGEALTLEPPETIREQGPTQLASQAHGHSQTTAREQRHAQQLKLIHRQEAGIWRVQPIPPGDTHATLLRYGQPPLPPYIRRSRPRASAKGAALSAPRAHLSRHSPQEPEARWTAAEQREEDTQEQGKRRTPGPDSGQLAALDAERYQTIYARQPGAVAAPTAGLHFTPQLFEALAAAGISTAFVTLHVGVGTFAPIRCADLADHPMHAEWYECPEATADALNAARGQGRRIVAVGTTSVRVLETCADEIGQVRPGSGWTRLFIYPPYSFKAVDAMLTNFHLPGSTLLAMVFAFAGREAILAAYEEAIRREYRFYSYGDAMLIV